MVTTPTTVPTVPVGHDHLRPVACDSTGQRLHNISFIGTATVPQEHGYRSHTVQGFVEVKRLSKSVVDATDPSHLFLAHSTIVAVWPLPAAVNRSGVVGQGRG